jgi:endonuclease/exonuclease/phosphatase family metal-dependent hydrolase
MEFNIEYGGTVIRFKSIVEAIRKADPDVVGIEEGQGNIPRLARALGWPYFNVRLQILSKYPLIDPPHGAGRYLFVEPSVGRVVAIGNVHLPAGPYGPNLILRGAKRKEILAIERRVRLPAVRPSVEALGKLVSQGIPSFLLGDFNTPSHHDWTDATVGLRRQILYPVHWPVTAFVERAGFADSYHEIHPDPATDPGLTWPADRPRPAGVWSPGPHAPADRIDFVFSAGDATPTDSVLVGESGGPGVVIEEDPWGTDHRSVLSTFSVRPAVPPSFVAPRQRLIDAGSEQTLTYHAEPGPSRSVAVIRAGGDPADPLWSAPIEGAADGTVSVVTEGWHPGTYVALLLDGADVTSHMRFWLREPGAPPRVWTTGDDYREGQPIRVRWADAPGERWDWIGVYRRGADPNVAYYLTWFYTRASIEGTGLLDDDAEGPWPLPPGRYSVYLLADDGYEVLARAPFTIVG